MATEALKSPSITNFDTPVNVTTGQGASGALKAVNDFATSTAGVTAGSTYRLCRIPTNACVKRVLLTNDAQGATGAIDIDIAHSDSVFDGTPVALQGTIPQIAAADNKLFGAATAITAAQKNLDITFGNIFTPQHQNIPLWNVLTTLGVASFSADPGGAFDILVKSTATLANGGKIAIEVDFVVDG